MKPNVKVEDLNVLSQETLITPKALKEELPLVGTALESVQRARATVKDILDRRDHRLFVVVGPCSIHDPEAALDYARQLAQLAAELEDSLYIVMRAYFEKPRTTVGWKGFINDPFLDDSFDIQSGLHLGRQLLLELAGMGLAIATEALDPVSPQYLQDLIAWSAIGARTTESQTHRELASGLSSAVGFKNGTDGGLMVAINALQSALEPHRFLGINHDGEVAVIRTKGNRHAHVVLRGGTSGPNYAAPEVQACEQRLKEAGAPINIMIDCSHANSMKDHRRQPVVVDEIASQIEAGNGSIVGLMLESNIREGKQAITNKDELAYGVSVTDACIDFETTRTCLLELRERAGDRLRNRAGREAA